MQHSSKPGAAGGPARELRRLPGGTASAAGGQPDQGGGLLVALEGIDGAGKTTTARAAAKALIAGGHAAVAADRAGLAGPAYASAHMAPLRELIWDAPPDAPYLELGDEHWVLLQAAWYSSFTRCAVNPLLDAGNIVVADTWGSKFGQVITCGCEGVRNAGTPGTTIQKIGCVRPRNLRILDTFTVAVHHDSLHGGRNGNPPKWMCAERSITVPPTRQGQPAQRLRQRRGLFISKIEVRDNSYPERCKIGADRQACRIVSARPWVRAPSASRRRAALRSAWPAMLVTSVSLHLVATTRHVSSEAVARKRGGHSLVVLTGRRLPDSGVGGTSDGCGSG